jgi:hypothetical protein
MSREYMTDSLTAWINDMRESMPEESKPMINALVYNFCLAKNQRVTQEVRNKAKFAVKILKLKLYNGIEGPINIGNGNEISVPVDSPVRKFL